MNHFPGIFRSSGGLISVLLAALIAGCGGSNLDPILGTPAAGLTPAAPTAPVVVPVPGVTPAPGGGTPEPADTTRPTVVLTVPAAGAADEPTNRKITAVFSEAMNPATLSTTSFTVANTTLGTPVAGIVSYSVGARMATFTPSALLANSTLFRATITTATTDLAGNALAGTVAGLPGPSNYVWTFGTGALADTTPPTITSVSPPDGTAGICLTRGVSATFDEPMDPETFTASTFTVTSNGTTVGGTVSYDAASRMATFVPTAAAGLSASTAFVATVKSGPAGVKDLAGNALVADRAWNFTTGAQPCAGGVNLGTSASFGAFGGDAGVTNQGIDTVVDGDLGTTAACTLITGFRDAANTYTVTGSNDGLVNGSVFCGPPAPGTTETLGIATQARADAQAAYDELAAMPQGSDPGAGELGGLVLAPGVYTSAGGTFKVTNGDLTLDAQGDANAVWVFQSASSLTFGEGATPRRMDLINGAQARNVFWQVGSAARIEDGSAMVGTIIAPAGVTISTAGQAALTTLTGRALGLTASVTMVNTRIVAP